MKFEIEITEEKVLAAIVSESWQFEKYINQVMKDEIEAGARQRIRAVMKEKIDNMIDEEMAQVMNLQEMIKQQIQDSVRSRVMKAFKKAVAEDA